MARLQFIDLFAGMGGVGLAFARAGFAGVYASDIDPFCKITYDANIGSMEVQDIRAMQGDALPRADVLTAGFPCQPFSIAGHRRGFEDEGRGSLFFEVVRLLRECEPAAVFLENVKNLKTHAKGETLGRVIAELEGAGYFVRNKVLSAAETGGVPQQRERIYIVGFRKKELAEAFVFPGRMPLALSVSDCLETSVATKYYYEGKPLYERLVADVAEEGAVYQWRRCYVRKNKSNLCPTLTANMGTGGHNVPIVFTKKGIRKLTPRECARLQGFPETFELPPIADSQLYKQLGNTVAVPVVERIAREMGRLLQGGADG